jgi:4-amino-4-deoxy-L-arabinose transferase-like glycosyltransferase
MSASTVSARACWWLFAAAIASSLPTLGYYLVGEEGILVNSSLEMAQRGEWRRLWLYGLHAMHGVFANWLVIIGAKLVGWEHAPAVTRAIMIASTATTGLMAGFLLYRLQRDAVLAVWAAVITVTFADVLFYRGWLGYRDPLLAMQVMGAITCLWLAVHERRDAWLSGVLLFAFTGFLNKGLIAYAYVGAAALVFLAQREARAYLLRPAPIVIAAATLAAPYLWALGLTGDQALNKNLGSEIGSKFAAPALGEYLIKLVTWPLDTFARLLPVPLLLWWYRKRLTADWLADSVKRTALIIAALCALPFWFTPSSHIRYILPALPLLAIALAAWVVRLDIARLVLRWLWALVALKFVVALVAFPIYQQKMRGENYAVTARDIVARTQGAALYIRDPASAGLSVAAYVNMARWPSPALTFAPQGMGDGYVLSAVEDPALGKTVQSYRLLGDTLHLLCRGAACDKTPP